MSDCEMAVIGGGPCPSWATWGGARIECELAGAHTMHEPRHAAEVGTGRAAKLVTWRADGERATTLADAADRLG